MIAVMSMVFLSSLCLTYIIRYMALKKDIVDHPNERSSHTIPTPKGGGLAIMITFYAALIYYYFQFNIDQKVFFALLAAVPVIIISFIDDIFSLSARIRLSVQMISAGIALYALGGVSFFHFGSFTATGPWLNIIAMLWIVWMTNLYNFLDGIDGYAGAEAIFVGIAGYILFGSEIALFIAIASAGFLVFNWHKASIFMGDVGSASLGFIFATLALNDAGSTDFLVWLILLSLFWFDATFTLLRRIKRGERLSKAHKNHAYQRFNQSGFRHDKVVFFAMSLNLLILTILFFISKHYLLLFFFTLVVLLYAITKWIDKKKGFD